MVLGNLLRYLARKSGLYSGARSVFIRSLLFPFITAGQLTTEEFRLLAELCRNSDANRPIIEVGTLFGRSTLVMAMNKAPAQQIITVDNYCWNPCGLSQSEHQIVTKFVLQEVVENDQVELLNVDKNEFYRTYQRRSPALVFLDADHSYEETARDIAWARSLDVDIISGHDYSGEFPGVTRAVDEAGGTSRVVRSLWVLNSDYG